MKMLLSVSTAVLGLLVLPSCTGISPSGAYLPDSGFSTGSRSSSSSVGLIRTNHSNWSYDPYRQAYYDREAERYYDTSRRRYYSSAPIRRTTVRYPANYRPGRILTAPSYLPNIGRVDYRRDGYRDQGRGYRDDYRDRRDDYRDRLKDARKKEDERIVKSEKRELEALLQRRKRAYEAEKDALARQFKSRPRSKAEKAAQKRRIDALEREFKGGNDQLRARFKSHVRAHH